MRDARMEFLSRSSRGRSAGSRRQSRAYGYGAGGAGYDYDNDHQEADEVQAGQRTLDETWHSQLHHLTRRMEQGIMEIWYGFGDVWDGATRPARSGGFDGVLGYGGRRAVRETVSVRVNVGTGVVRLKWRDQGGRVVGVEEVGMY